MAHIENERLAYLDFLRGFAVLGLLLMNAPFMGLIEFGYVAHQPVVISDYVIAVANSLLLDGRFRSLFCLLFGIGIYLQYCSFARKGYAVNDTLLSRLNWLLVFGLIHCIFIWEGDILILYALSGFFLIKRLHWSADKQLKTGLIFFAVGIVILFGEVALNVVFDEGVTRQSKNFLQAYESLKGNYFESLFMSAAMAVLYFITFPILSLFYLCGVMLIGIGLFRTGKLKNGFKPRELHVLLIVTALFSLASVVVLFYDFYLWQNLSSALCSVAGLTMALLIWHMILKTKLYLHNNWFVSAVTKVGTMALSFYILQSIVFVSIFRIVMPELILTNTLLHYFLMAIGFALIQLLIASAYKTCFNQGPLEALWRHLVDYKLEDTSEPELKQ